MHVECDIYFKRETGNQVSGSKASTAELETETLAENTNTFTPLEDEALIQQQDTTANIQGTGKNPAGLQNPENDYAETKAGNRSDYVSGPKEILTTQPRDAKRRCEGSLSSNEENKTKLKSKGGGGSR